MPNDPVASSTAPPAVVPVPVKDVITKGAPATFLCCGDAESVSELGGELGSWEGCPGKGLRNGLPKVTGPPFAL